MTRDWIEVWLSTEQRAKAKALGDPLTWGGRIAFAFWLTLPLSRFRTAPHVGRGQKPPDVVIGRYEIDVRTGYGQALVIREAKHDPAERLYVQIDADRNDPSHFTIQRWAFGYMVQRRELWRESLDAQHAAYVAPGFFLNAEQFGMDLFPPCLDELVTFRHGFSYKRALAGRKNSGQSTGEKTDVDRSHASSQLKFRG